MQPRIRPDLIGLVRSEQVRDECFRARDLNNRVYELASIFLSYSAGNDINDFKGAWIANDAFIDNAIKGVVYRIISNSEAKVGIRTLGDGLQVEILELEEGITNIRNRKEVLRDKEDILTLGKSLRKIGRSINRVFTRARDQVSSEVERAVRQVSSEVKRVVNRVENAFNSFAREVKRWERYVKPIIKIVLGISLIILSFFAEAVGILLTVVSGGLLSGVLPSTTALALYLWDLGFQFIQSGIAEAQANRLEHMQRSTQRDLDRILATGVSDLIKQRLLKLDELSKPINNLIDKLFKIAYTASVKQRQNAIDLAQRAQKALLELKVLVAENKVSMDGMVKILKEMQNQLQTMIDKLQGIIIFGLPMSRGEVALAAGSALVATGSIVLAIQK